MSKTRNITCFHFLKHLKNLIPSFPAHFIAVLSQKSPEQEFYRNNSTQYLALPMLQLHAKNKKTSDYQFFIMLEKPHFGPKTSKQDFSQT